MKSRYELSSERVGFERPEDVFDWPSQECAKALIEEIKEGAGEVAETAFDNCLRLIRFGDMHDGNKGRTRHLISREMCALIVEWQKVEPVE